MRFGGGFRRHARREHFMLGPRRSLQRRVFLWFGATIVTTGLAVALVFSLLGPGRGHVHDQLRGAERLVAEQFASVWDRPVERAALAERVARTLDLTVSVENPSGQVLERFGSECAGPSYRVEVRRGSALLGRVRGCATPRPRAPLTFLLALFAAVATLWLSSAWIARRIARPLFELVRVTREIGAGKLSARVRLGRHQPGEVGVVADAVNDMAARIEKQLRDQRELLAAVSHEIRSPLARLRLLTELCRDGATRDRAIADLEREIVEMDQLVGKLLSSSRLDFEALRTKVLPAAELGERALELAGVERGLLEDRSAGARLEVDATLIGRALVNLLENAATHGGGVEKLTLRREPPSHLVFEVADAGHGFSAADLPRVFEPFFRSGERGHGNLGLGLSLVSRIASAHGGTAFAANRPAGGAVAGIKLPIVAAR